MPHQYPSEFRQRVLALLDAGAKVADIAADLDVSANAIYNWRNQHLIDAGQRPGRSTTESAELKAARRDPHRLARHLRRTSRSRRASARTRRDRRPQPGRSADAKRRPGRSPDEAPVQESEPGHHLG